MRSGSSAKQRPRSSDVRSDAVLARVMVAEDDEASRTVMARFLRRANYEVIEAVDGREAIAAARDVDAVLLDVMLPGMDGWDVLTVLREQHPDLPVLFVTALSDAENELRGLRAGADDYLGKPIDLDVMHARLTAALRRRGVAGTRDFGPLRIDLTSRSVSIDDQAVDLTRTEFELLALLSSQPGRVFTRDHLLDAVWGKDFDGVERVVDVRLSTLRRKLGDDGREPRFITTVRGVGYRFVR
jgi:two-component system, OmpR family, alkaline phosphatase synthesis response regulator PhoP